MKAAEVFAELIDTVHRFRVVWGIGVYHRSKDIAMTISIESARVARAFSLAW